MDGSPEPLAPSQMEDDSSHPSSCESAPPTPKHHQLSNFESSSIGVGDGLEEIATGPRNLWAKRITAIWGNRSKDFRLLSVLRPSNRKRKTKANHKADCGSDKATNYPT